MVHFEKCTFKILINSSVSLGKLLLMILELIEVDSSITTFELAEKCGKSRTTIQSYIRMLKKDKRIERVGANKGGKWRIL